MKALPPVWIDALAATLRDADHDVSSAALSVVRAAPVTKEPQPVIQAAVKEVALDARRPRDVRLDALAAMDGVEKTTPFAQSSHHDDLLPEVWGWLPPARIPKERSGLLPIRLRHTWKVGTPILRR